MKGFLAFGVFISDGIASHVAIDIIWRTYVVDKIQNRNNKLLYEYVLRTAIVILTCKDETFCEYGILMILLKHYISF